LNFGVEETDLFEEKNSIRKYKKKELPLKKCNGEAKRPTGRIKALRRIVINQKKN